MRRHAAVAPLLLLVAGCGGGLSKDELVAKGDAICKRVNARIAKQPDPQSAADLKRLAQRTTKIYDPAIDDMEALDPPSELESDFKKFVASLRRLRDLTKRIGDAAGKGDTATIKQVSTDAQKVQQEYRRLTGKIGFKECGGV
jgi:hypothetical protein